MDISIFVSVNVNHTGVRITTFTLLIMEYFSIKTIIDDFYCCLLISVIVIPHLKMRACDWSKSCHMAVNKSC